MSTIVMQSHENDNESDLALDWDGINQGFECADGVTKTSLLFHYEQKKHTQKSQFFQSCVPLLCFKSKNNIQVLHEKKKMHAKLFFLFLMFV